MENKKYKLVIFDFDGTLADTSEGILNCHKHALVSMGRTEPTDEELAGIIGGQLLTTYIDRFKFSEEDAVEAVKIYRDRYAEKGIFEFKMYDGMADTLRELRRRGYKTAIATLKAERFAKLMMKNQELDSLFDIIHGVDEQDKLTKTALVDMCVSEAGVKNHEAILVGDSMSDANGAEKSDVDMLAVTYGFGFSSEDDLKNVRHHFIVSSPLEILEKLQ